MCFYMQNISCASITLSRSKDCKVFEMHPPKPLFAKVLMSVLTGTLASTSVLGNGFFIAVIARFKTLRTFPNILAANLALVDLLNAVIKMPSYMMGTIVEASWFRGKALAFTAVILNRLFLLLNLASMLAMMIDTYLAISHDLTYFGWKTNKKAIVCVALIWLISSVTVMLFSIPLLFINLGDAHVIEYRAEIYKQGRYFVAAFMAFFIVCGAIVSVRTVRAVKEKKKQRAELNLPPIRAAARLKEDIKVIKTIAITIAVYILSYVPAIVYAAVGLQKETLADSWFAFIAWYSICISSALKPIIYYLRSSRRRSAFKQFLKDPFGSSDFKEKPNDPGKSGKRNDGVAKRKKNVEGAVSGEACEVRRGGNQTRQKYSSQRRNAVMVLSLKGLETGLYLHHELVNGSGYKGWQAKQGSKGVESSLQVQILNKSNGEETKTANNQVPSKQRQRYSFNQNIHPLEDSEMANAEEPYEENPVSENCPVRSIDGRDTSGKRRIAIKTGQKVENVSWQAQEKEPEKPETGAEAEAGAEPKEVAWVKPGKRAEGAREGAVTGVRAETGTEDGGERGAGEEAGECTEAAAAIAWSEAVTGTGEGSRAAADTGAGTSVEKECAREEARDEAEARAGARTVVGVGEKANLIAGIKTGSGKRAERAGEAGEAGAGNGEKGREAEEKADVRGQAEADAGETQVGYEEGREAREVAGAGKAGAGDEAERRGAGQVVGAEEEAGAGAGDEEGRGSRGVVGAGGRGKGRGPAGGAGEAGAIAGEKSWKET